MLTRPAVQITEFSTVTNALNEALKILMPVPVQTWTKQVVSCLVCLRFGPGTVSRQ